MSPSPFSAQGLATSAGAATGATALAGDGVPSVRSPWGGGLLRAWGHWARSWLRPTVALYLPADQPERAFDAWCRAHPGVPVRLLLAGGLTHQAVQPSPAAPGAWASWGGRSAATQSTRAAQDWAQHYGPQAHAWPLATWRGAGREGSVALHGASLAALQRSAQACGVRLRAVVPLWAALLPWADARQPQWWCAGPRARLAPGKGTGTGTGAGTTDAPTAALAVVEGALLTWVQCSPVGVREVLQRRLGAPTAEALEQKINSLRTPQQRVLVVGFGLDAGSAAAAQAAKATKTTQTSQTTQTWPALTPLDASALPGPVLQALATPPWARRAARRWPTPDVLRRPGSLGVLDRCLVLMAWLGLAGSAALWQHSHANFTQALRQRDAAAASLQSARLAQRSTPLPVAANAAGTGAGTVTSTGAPRTARPVQPGGTPADVHLQARKVMAGLRYAWAGLLLPIEAAASGNVRWLELDCSTEGGPAGGRVRLLGQASSTAAALDAVQTLSAQNGWSQVVLSKVQDTSARDPQGGVRFELTALYRSLPPAPATEAQ